MTGVLARRKMLATCVSRSVMPFCTSTTKRIRSASSVARATCLRISSSKISSELTTQPPVSTSENSRVPHSHLPYWRSRVVPASSLTMAWRVPVSRLKSVDFPTLGRPTMATKLDMRYNVLLVRGEHSLTASLTRNICKNSDFYLMYKDLRGIKGGKAGSFSGLGLLCVERWMNVK